MSEPRVSIITATLNAEEHLRETLDTLMRQSLSE